MDNSSKQPIVVTGAGSGIGRAVCVELGRRGFPIGMLGRSTSSLHGTCKLLRNANCPAFDFQIADVTDQRQVQRAISKIMHNLGLFGGVVACAGIGGVNTPGNGDRWDLIIRTNLYGVYHTLRATTANIDQDARIAKHFIVIGSLLARIGISGSTAYCASKAGLCGLVRAFAVELAGRNIRVNIVNPGWVTTPMARRSLRRLGRLLGMTEQAAARLYGDALPLRRLCKASEVARLVGFLVEGGDEGFTGAAFDLNNGAWMG